MRGGPLISIAASGASRWARLVLGLLRHDPLFRYAAIAAMLALFFIVARFAQDVAGPGAIPPAGSDRVDNNAVNPDDQPPVGEKPPPPGSAVAPPVPGDARPPTILPGRSLQGVEVEPAPPDRFGTLPQGDNAE